MQKRKIQSDLNTPLLPLSSLFASPVNSLSSSPSPVPYLLALSYLSRDELSLRQGAGQELGGSRAGRRRPAQAEWAGRRRRPPREAAPSPPNAAGAATWGRAAATEAARARRPPLQPAGKMERGARERERRRPLWGWICGEGIHPIGRLHFKVLDCWCGGCVFLWPYTVFLDR